MCEVRRYHSHCRLDEGEGCPLSRAWLAGRDTGNDGHDSHSFVAVLFGGIVDGEYPFSSCSAETYEDDAC